MARAPKKKRTFHQELVLNRWMLSHFDSVDLARLKERLGEARHEGIDQDGQTKFFHELTRDLFSMDRITEADLRRYDMNIVTHWQKITHRRNAATGEVLTMKYFQYLSLLFTEIYLDWYFHRKQDLLDGLNAQMAEYRAEDGAEQFQDYTDEDLNKLAFWSATGSGKTLILHVNILQYLQYFKMKNGGLFPDRIVLLTPNEGLSRQHLEEFRMSDISAHAFEKQQSGLPLKGCVDVIEVTKLSEEMGDKTIATSAFEGNNLILVDEGHRGAGTAGGAWMMRRAALVKGGFAFEYSATFSQSVAKGLTVAKAEEEIIKSKAKQKFDKTLRQLSEVDRSELRLTAQERAQARVSGIREAYAKAVIFDYSYKYFYADGYGKESLILNLDQGGYVSHKNLYLTACLLSFYQQLWLWSTHRDKIADFGIEKPLWVFVGNTVSGEDSDILDVIGFLAWFLNNRPEAVSYIADLVEDKARLLDPKGDSIFSGRFLPLMQFNGNTIYKDILRLLFNAESQQRLKVVNLRNSKGEIALRVGSYEPFGLINIGDDSGLFKNAEALSDFDTDVDEFGETLFGTINRKDSALSVLIGSRKFTEGWSSWRVSTMGLLNMGTGEGSQIIQLFGRGVRLKGRSMSLKRSLVNDRPRGTYLELLETLNVFGVKANYMSTFRDYLREEGVPLGDEVIQIDFNTKLNLPLHVQLKTLKIKDGYGDNQGRGFVRSQVVSAFEVPDDLSGKIKVPHFQLDLYPRVAALSSRAGSPSDLSDARYHGKIPQYVVDCFDWAAITRAVREHKSLRGWSNLLVEADRLIEFASDDSWYTLFAPSSFFVVSEFGDVLRLQDVFIQLVIGYADRFYRSVKAAYEGSHYEIEPVTDENGSIVKLYQFDIDDSEDGLVYKSRIEQLSQLVASGQIGEASRWNAPHMVAISFSQHLYYPLLSPVKGRSLPFRMRPLTLSEPSEVQFVEDVRAFYNSNSAKGLLSGLSLYLLRNSDVRSKGLGFARSGNFYPDFLLWLVDDATGKQWVSFIDPKGIRNMDIEDPKFGLYTEVKRIEEQLADKTISLSAFILSATRYKDLINIKGVSSQSDLEARNVLFMDAGGDTYMKILVERMLGFVPAVGP